MSLNVQVYSVPNGYTLDSTGINSMRPLTLSRLSPVFKSKLANVAIQRY